jgi:hypothetical protein
VRWVPSGLTVMNLLLWPEADSYASIFESWDQEKLKQADTASLLQVASSRGVPEPVVGTTSSFSVWPV